MEKAELKKLIEVAAGRRKADLVLKNCRVVNVFSGKIEEGDVAISDKWIAGVGKYEGEKRSTHRADMQRLVILTAIFISNHLMSVRKSLESCWFLTVPQPLSPILTRS